MATHIANASGITVASASTDTALQLVADSTAKVAILEWGASFNGRTVADPPILVELVRFATAGTGGTTITAANMETDSLGPSFGGTVSHTITTEGGTPVVLDSIYVRVDGGAVRLQPPVPVIVQVSGIIAVRFTSGTMTSVSGQASLTFRD